MYCTFNGWRRSSRILGVSLAGALLWLGAPAGQASPWASPGDREATGRQHVRAMVGCPLWLPSLRRCLSVPADAAGAAGSLEPSDGFGPRGPDYEGLKRDTYYFLGLQLTIVGTLYLMPESVSGWSEEQKNQHRFKKWWNNVSGPAWDSDDHYINYVLHPYWGGAYYVRARERGYGKRDAFWYSFLLSTLYEAGLEAFFEPVSIQDFFVTPIAGSWLGGHFMTWRDATRKRMAETGEVRFRDKALLVATDPLGNAADFVARRLGRDVSFRMAPFVADLPAARSVNEPWRTSPGDDGTMYGVTLELRW